MGTIKRLLSAWLLSPLFIFITACSQESTGSQATDEERVLAAAAGAATQVAANVDGTRIRNADSEPQNWLSHGPGGISSGDGTADLRYASASVHASWDAIVRGGAYAGKGMASFASVLAEEDATAIQAYIVEQTENSIALCQSEYRKNYPELLESACARPQTASAP